VSFACHFSFVSVAFIEFIALYYCIHAVRNDRFIYHSDELLTVIMNRQDEYFEFTSIIIYSIVVEIHLKYFNSFGFNLETIAKRKSISI